MSVLLFLLPIIIINAQNVTEIIEPKCDGETIKYSIYANLSEYFENENNIDGREIYESLDALKSKKIGTLTGMYFNRSMFDNITDYNSYDDLIDDLRKHKLDAIALNGAMGNNTQMFENDISIFPGRPILIDIGIGFQKDNVTLLNQVNEFIAKGNLVEKKKVWMGINYQIQYINKTLSGENGIINAVVLLNNPPYSYKDKSGEMTGADLDFIYGFARDYGYQINLITTNSQDEEIELLKNKSADIAVGYFPIREDKRDEISFSNF
jgi:ABC-type amino acid transport substrate-binding protein